MVMEGFFSCKIEPQFDDHEDGDEEACHSDNVKLYDITFIKFVYILECFCSHVVIYKEQLTETSSANFSTWISSFGSFWAVGANDIFIGKTNNYTFCTL